ncbi:MAG TPA: hypothetical protein VMU19_11885 [Bryobacteraceae bacterium]|nr:hypothetical protein [Bryobacteraceae bacterium]
MAAGSILGAGLTAVKLLNTGLFRRYPYFFAFLLINTPIYAALLYLPTRSDFYFYLWEAVQPISWILYMAMVFELYRLILERHKALYTFGRRAMYLGIGVAATISALALLPHFQPQTRQISTVLPYLLAGERAVDFSLAIFLILLMFLLGGYAVPLCRNVVVHGVIYTVYFLCNTLGTLLRSALGLTPKTDVMNLAMTALSAACTFAWFLLLTRKGEEARVKRPWIGKEQEQRILSQLDAMNAALLRPARK